MYHVFTSPVYHYRIHWLCRVPVTLGKGQFALGKLFAECYTWQTPLGKASHGKAIFAECRISGTRQRLCREPWHSAKQPRGATLGRHFGVWHSAKCRPRVAPRGRFAECQVFSTRQSTVVLSCGRPLCRVYWLKHSAKWSIFLFLLLFSLFFDTNTTNIYINAGVITGSYNDKYIIVNCDNSIDTNNTR